MTQHDYDRYLDDFGARVSRAAAPPPSPSRPPRRRLALGLGGTAVATAAVVATVLAVGGGAAGDRLDVVAEARAALAPEGKIVHMVLRTDVQLDGLDRGADATSEIWSAEDRPRWRLRQTLPDIREGRIAAAVGSVQELSYGDGVQRIYTAKSDELREQDGLTDDSPVATPPSFLQAGSNDPAAGLRRRLERGELRDTGEIESGGRTVRRLVASSDSGRTRQEFVYDVDPETFAPVGGSVTTTSDETSGTTFVFSFRVERYETLPDTPENAGLLRITTTPSTKVLPLRG